MCPNKIFTYSSQNFSVVLLVCRHYIVHLSVLLLMNTDKAAKYNQLIVFASRPGSSYFSLSHNLYRLGDLLVIWHMKIYFFK